MGFVTLLGIALWSLIPGFIAKKKERSFWGYYFLSFLISPLITMIIIICLPKKFEFDDFNEICFCRKCGEKLVVNSKFCGKCGTEIVEVPIETFWEPDNSEFCKTCGADITGDIDVCHVCGEPKEEL